MKIDLSSIIEQGEGPVLLFEKRTGVIYTWRCGGKSPHWEAVEGYAVPVGDSVIREQLKQIHIGCRERLSEHDADQLDSIFRIAGVPFTVLRGLYYPTNTENLVWVAFPSWAEQTPIPGSRLDKWRALWGKRALFVWWNCETESEYEQRLQRESSSATDEADDERDMQAYFDEVAASAWARSGVGEKGSE